MKELTIMEAPLEGCFCVDLNEDADKLPDGWRFILKNNCYTGWGSSDGIVFAEVERIPENETVFTVDPDSWDKTAMKEVHWISGGAVARENDDSLTAVCGYPQAPDAAEELADELGEQIARWFYVNGWDGVDAELGLELVEC